MADHELYRLLRAYFPFGFPTSLEGWQRFEVNRLLARETPFADENVRYTVRRLADAYNQRPATAGKPADPVQAEQLLSLGVLTDAMRYVALHFGLRERPGALKRAHEWARRRVGEAQIDKLPGTFLQLFPPGEVAAQKLRLDEYAGHHEQPLSLPERITVESILLYLQARNRATRPFRELFDDEDLQRRVSYVPFVVHLEEFFDSEDPSGLSGHTLFHTLRAPILASPDSLEGQLAWVREHWGAILPEDILSNLDLARDLLREMDLRRAPEYGPPPVLEFGAPGGDQWAEPAAFSHDADWMSNVVLMAKSTYVWLDQLGKRYGRHISTLADVPDEELDRLARWGCTGLWLIGLWERSRASARIKQYMGNPEAVASAYSLYDYVIASDLGGEAAYRDLRDRAWQRGIRLASDMVPNHMGIDSRWVIEHPDWFLQLSHPPYPAYRFTGGDLCDHPDVEVRLEEGYWTHSDAAVVFERKDSRTGQTRYIYHGNDGTSMPWNDTAQLDFTRPEVREGVIQTILHVARQFPIIRFDAAMTLAKKHIQRLWFPAPGDAGGIPSRAEHGMTREQFDQAIPKEFWREVVDRVKAEVPDTLLLAEAFWLMEGYFVRTLGMHRVYNSAFMNMLKMEENQKYRQTIKNVLEFSPAVLQRFVNFMNNPDERTAVEQFGKGDKYFGVATLLVTMPGLPMIGHGQVEGFAEKYGMEYRRAYWDEAIDEDMVRRHEREIFPLMKHRDLFSGAEHFALFDFVTGGGTVDENVFAYTNRAGQQRAVVLYNNAYPATSGRIHTSSAINVAGDDQPPRLEHRSLAQALGLQDSGDLFYAYRDHVAGLEFLRTGAELTREGLWVELHGYQAQVLVDFREMHDEDGRWRELHQRLEGRPVPDLWRARRELELDPILSRVDRVTSPEALATAAGGSARERDALAGELVELLDAAAAAAGRRGSPRSREDLAAALADLAAVPEFEDAAAREALGLTDASIAASHTVGYLERLLVWLGQAMGDAVAGAGPDTRPPRLTAGDLWLVLDRARPGIAATLGDTISVETALQVARLLAQHPELLVLDGATPWRTLLTDPDGQAFLQSNRFEGVWYFAKDPLENLLQLALPVVLRRSAATGVMAADIVDRALTARDAAAAAGYRQEIFLSRVARGPGESIAPRPEAARSPAATPAGRDAAGSKAKSKTRSKTTGKGKAPKKGAGKGKA